MNDVAADIVAACQMGDRDAQRRFYEMFNRKVFALMARMTGTGEAEDLTQQVFLQAFRKIDQFSGAARIDTWLYRLAVNEALQYLRKKKRAEPQSLLQEPAHRAPKHTARVEQRELLEQGLRRLEPELRSLFLLREVEELSYRELAESLGISEGTVASRLNRARRQLKRRLVELGWEP